MEAFLVLTLAIACLMDLRVQKIPNWLTFPAAFIGIVGHTWTCGFDGLLFSLGGMFVGIFFFFIPYALGGMGAGDAKLVGAVGAFLGPVNVAIASLLIGLTGGLYALILMTIHRKYGRSFVSRLRQTIITFFLMRRIIYDPAPENENQPRLCYGVAIALGTIIFISLQSAGYRFPIV